MHGLRHFTIALMLATCAGLFLAPSARAQNASFLDLGDIPGGSADPAHMGQIQVEAYSLGGASDGESARFFDVTVSNNLDQAAPALLLAMASGRVLSSAVIETVRPGGGGVLFKVELSDVRITSVSIAGADTLSSSITLSFKKARWTYSDSGASVTTGWDTEKNGEF